MGGRILVAIDFGTTYSAIGYARVEDGMEPEDLDFHLVDRGWPGQGRRQSPKIPSVYKFSGDEFLMGFEVEDDENRVQFPKLFLDPNQLRQSQQLASLAAAKVEQSEENLLRGISRYLESLRHRALEHMKLETWSEDFVNRSQMDFVLSVPAIWSDRAKANTMECASRAGIGSPHRPSSLRLVSEPEAAMLYSITTLPDETWTAGNVCLLVDAGGGTVDLATYRITSLKPRLQVAEETVGNGGLCGSTILNMRFKEFIVRKLGYEPSKGELNEIMIKFNDEIKREFDGGDDIYFVEVPPNTPDKPDEGIENGALVIMAEDLRSIFDPVIQRILVLIQIQLDRIQESVPRGGVPLLLVGGFGSSEYLKAQIMQKFPTCNVLRPPDAWSAVVRGALYRAMVKTRKIRQHYGIMFREHWERSKHEEGPLAELARSNKEWDQFEGRYKCGQRMNWYAKKGDEFDDSTTVEFPFYGNFGLQNPLTNITVELWAYLDGEEGKDGPAFKDLDCHQIALLKPDFSAIPRSEFPRLKSPGGETYIRINYDIVMTFDTVIEFKLKYKGQVRGNVRAQYLESGPGRLHAL